jgi:putative addiction module component (TIGR02574 family)
VSRIDQAKRLIRAQPATLYRAFATAHALESWLPPKGMSGKVLAFDFREGGRYRMRLAYEGAHDVPGKSSAHADEVEVRIVKLVPDERIEQAVVFDAEDPAFAGTMRITWTFEAVAQGTEVTVRCENVPAGIRPEDHAKGLASTLENLAAFAGGTLAPSMQEPRMSDPVEELSHKARALPPEDRVRLAEELLASVQEVSPEVEAAWDEEIRRRVAEIDSGKVKLVPAEEVFAEVRRLLK